MKNLIKKKCEEIANMLIEKNRKYGNSALNPLRIFSKADKIEQLKVRIDDKLNRIKNQQIDEDEDVVKDLVGYLVLLMIAQDHQKETLKTKVDFVPLKNNKNFIELNYSKLAIFNNDKEDEC